MLDSYRLKRIILITILLLINLMLLTGKNDVSMSIDNKSYVIGCILDIENYSIVEDKEETQEEYVSEEIIDEYNVSEVVINTYSGDLTGDSADCPACYGTLGCLPSYNVYRNGVLTYPDKTYGNVRIVATSKNIPCGSIIKFQSNLIGTDEVYAIVLDRGVYNYDIDLLVPSESFAYQYIGRSKIKYDLLRYGW